MKKRLELIEELEKIQYNIETVERYINLKIEDTTYYQVFGTKDIKGFEHLKEIRIKALAYWKRRFNRTLKKLYYEN